MTLLDYVEIIRHNLRKGIHKMDLTVIPAPYIKIEEYETYFTQLNLKFQNFNKARHTLVNYDANALLKQDNLAEYQSFESRKSLATANKRKEAAGYLASDAATLLNELNTMRSDILQNIINLNNYGMGAQHISLPKALEQARFNLESIQQQADEFRHIRSSFNCAWHYLYYFGNASDAAFDTQANISMFWRDLNQTNHRISDMRLILDRIMEQQNEIEDIEEHIINTKTYLLQDCREIQDTNNIIEKQLNNSLVSETDTIIEMNIGLQQQLEGEIGNINRLGTMLNNTLIEQDAVHREVRKHWLPKAEKHALRLMERSNEYARQFQPTRNGARIALLARYVSIIYMVYFDLYLYFIIFFISSAHKNISDAINAARKSSVEARERVLIAQMTLYPEQGTSVIETAEKSLSESRKLQKLAEKEMQKTKGILYIT